MTNDRSEIGYRDARAVPRWTPVSLIACSAPPVGVQLTVSAVGFGELEEAAGGAGVVEGVSFLLCEVEGLVCALGVSGVEDGVGEDALDADEDLEQVGGLLWPEDQGSDDAN